MFVSSYNTYIATNTADKVSKKRDVSATKEQDFTFSSKLIQNSLLESTTIKNLPVNYISNYKAFSNKQKLQQDLQNKELQTYTKTKAQITAQSEYAQNSKMFSLLIKPSPVVLDNLPKANKELSQDLKDAKEQDLRKKMVNTYAENNRYFYITAA